MKYFGYTTEEDGHKHVYSGHNNYYTYREYTKDWMLVRLCFILDKPFPS